MLHGERDLQSEIQLMISGGRIWLLTGCMIPKSAQPSSEECALFSASQSEPTQHKHMWLRRPPRSPEASRRRRHAQSDQNIFAPNHLCCKTWSFIGTTTTGSSLVHCKLYWEPACAALRLGSDARLN